MTLYPWYFLTFWVAPVPTEPVLTPFVTLEACNTFLQTRLTAWELYVIRNRPALRVRPNESLVASAWIGPHSPHRIALQGVGGFHVDEPTFKVIAGPLTVWGICTPGAELSPESLKSIGTSP
jgi:hypothetical protein